MTAFDFDHAPLMLVGSVYHVAAELNCMNELLCSAALHCPAVHGGHAQSCLHLHVQYDARVSSSTQTSPRLSTPEPYPPFPKQKYAGDPKMFQGEFWAAWQEVMNVDRFGTLCAK